MAHKLTFWDRFGIYRLQGMSIRVALRFAWQYRNFVPDHSGSQSLREEMQRLATTDPDALLHMLNV